MKGYIIFLACVCGWFFPVAAESLPAFHVQYVRFPFLKSDERLCSMTTIESGGHKNFLITTNQRILQAPISHLKREDDGLVWEGAVSTAGAVPDEGECGYVAESLSRSGFKIDKNDIQSSPASVVLVTASGLMMASSKEGVAKGIWKIISDKKTQGMASSALAFSLSGERLFVVRHGRDAGVEAYDGSWHRLPTSFVNPFDYDFDGKLDVLPISVLPYRNDDGRERVLVGFADHGICLSDSCDESVADNNTAAGHIAEYNSDGKLLSIWRDKGFELMAPRSMAFMTVKGDADKKLLLVVDRGTEKVAIFNPATRSFMQYANDADGNAIRLPRPDSLISFPGSHRHSETLCIVSTQNAASGGGIYCIILDS